MLTCKRQRSLKLWNACPTVWVKLGRRAKQNCLSLLSEITVTSKPWRGGGVRGNQTFLSLSISILHSALLSTLSSQHRLTLTHVNTIPVNMTSKPCVPFLQNERSENYGWWTDFCSFLFPTFQFPRRRMIACKMSTLIHEWDDQHSILRDTFVWV